MAYIEYAKLPKKKKKEIDNAKRNTWGSISPVTKKVASQKVYNRKKTQRRQEESQALGFCFALSPCGAEPIKPDHFRYIYFFPFWVLFYASVSGYNRRR